MTLFMLELLVADWRAAVAWYGDCLGFTLELTDEPHGFAFLHGHGTRLALKSGQPQMGTITPFFQVDDLSALLEQLAGLGIALEGDIKESDEGYRRVFIRDLDGYRIGLFEWANQPPA